MGEAIAHGLAAVGRLAIMPELALDLMLGVRLVARGYSNQTLKLRAQAMAEGFATEWQRAIVYVRGCVHGCVQTKRSWNRIAYMFQMTLNTTFECDAEVHSYVLI